jgi:Tfp pilus assembly protein PilV
MTIPFILAMFVLPAAIISLAVVLARITRSNKRSSHRNSG